MNYAEIAGNLAKLVGDIESSYMDAEKWILEAREALAALEAKEDVPEPWLHDLRCRYVGVLIRIASPNPYRPDLCDRIERAIRLTESTCLAVTNQTEGT
jgi:hypothetical protein